MRTLVGILGGMGPAATAAFYQRLVQLTPANHDQEHLPVVIWADPSVPDRTAAFQGQGPSVLPWLERGLRVLKNAGAGIVVSPCNTAHIWLPDVARAESVELLSIIEATVDAMGAGAAAGAKVGLLATNATLASGLYQKSLGTRRFDPIIPTPSAQGRLVEGIYRVKAGRIEEATRLMGEAVAELVEGGASAVISGCTEVSVVLAQQRLSVPVVDSIEALAAAVLKRALHGANTSSCAAEHGA